MALTVRRDAAHLVFRLFGVVASLAAKTRHFIGAAAFQRHEGEAVGGLVPLETNHPRQALPGPALGHHQVGGAELFQPLDNLGLGLGGMDGGVPIVGLFCES
jgi:hypothetical protein